MLSLHNEKSMKLKLRQQKRVISSRFQFWFAVSVVLLSSVSSGFTQVILDKDPMLEKIDIVEHLGDTIPLNLMVTNEQGKQVSLNSYFVKDRPVILMLGYYECPMLCNLVFNGMAEAVKLLPLKAGEEYQILSVSIDPTETAELARAKKQTYANAVGKADIQSGWQFLTADTVNSSALAQAVGFKYFYDEKRAEYAHAACAYILSPTGVITRYHYGIEFQDRDIRWSLIEASKGKIGSTLDRLILYCYHYDPEAGSYAPMATRIMQLGGLLTMAVVGSTIIVLRRHEKRPVKSGSEHEAQPAEVHHG